MQTEKTITPRPGRTGVQRVARALLKVILFLFLFIIALALLLLTPPVQRLATTQVENYLEKKLKTRVEIGSLHIGLPRRVVLNEVYIEDQTKDTLIAGGQIRLNIELFKLFSNELQVNDAQFTDMTAKVKRLLPDTVFNFQFLIDAFTAQQAARPDTAQSPVMKLAVDNLSLNNIHLVYRDVITGNDMRAYIRSAAARIDTLDPYGSRYSIASVTVSGMRLRFYQETPLLKPEPLAADLAKVGQPLTTHLRFGTIQLKDVAIDYGNTESALFTQFQIGNFWAKGKDFDLPNRRLHLAGLRLDNSVSVIRLGKKEGAKVLQQEVTKEVAVQQNNNWTFLVDDLRVTGNRVQFDNDLQPRQGHGIDYAHFRGDDLTLHAENLQVSTDSMRALVQEARFREKSGFILESLRGDFFHSPKQTFVKNLYLKTPGSQIQRDFTLDYPSLKAITERPEQVVMNIDLANSRVQVKDILAFAPQLRQHPAFTNPLSIWRLNIQGSGTLSRLYFKNLQFTGLKNTIIDASGTLSGMGAPATAGGTFTIRRLHTSQTDLSLFTGQRLSTPEVNLPETFSATGVLSGNAERLQTNLTIATAFGNVSVNGLLSNFTNPERFGYNAQVTTRSLRLDKILRNQVPVGALSASVRLTGQGVTPDGINSRIQGTVYSVGYGGYTYQNIKLDGRLTGNRFSVATDIRDPNVDLTGTASGSFASTSSFRLDAFIDSVKTLPLRLTTQPLTFRGKIIADITSLSKDYLDADVFITDALFVSGKDRLPMDTLHFTSGHQGPEQFMRLRSSIANASLQGRYRFSELGQIIQANLQPYFSVTGKGRAPAVQPYDFSFSADLASSPFFSVFVPGLKVKEPIHAEGSLATSQGLQAKVTTAALDYGTNAVTDLSVNVTTTPQGLQFTGNAGHLVSGNAFDVYNTRLTATALNNIIDFNLDIDDKAKRDKYLVRGILTQPSPGHFSLQLRPDSLLLNYELWNVSAGNRLLITPTNISATDFTLQKGQQLMSLQSVGGPSGPLRVDFNAFRVATVTGFMKSDSLLADGVINGEITFRNLMQQPLFTGALTVTDLTMRQDTLGNLSLQVNTPSFNRYVASATLSGRGNDIALTGEMAPQPKGDVDLNLNMDVRQMQLNTFEGALKEAVTKAEGTLDGNIKITGSLAQPALNGRINFNDTRFNTVFLGNDFRIDKETIEVGNDGFRFNNFSIKDSANNALTLNGNVSTPNFINYNFNLQVVSDNFRALNTTKKQNSIYYGQLYLTTDMHIAGTERSPVIDGAVTIVDGTNLTVVVPQPEPGVQEREGVVTFVDKDAPLNDSLFMTAYDSLNISNLVGYNIAANIEIRKEAVVSLVIDAANGDLVNLQGEALLTGGIDPSGKITLTGSYILEQGSYDFSLNFLNRKFNIQKGSSIVWLGEPTRATLDVTGLYVANASPIDLVQDQLDASSTAIRNTYLQKLPFQVFLKVTGEMMKPQVAFDIILPPERSYAVSKDIIQSVDTRLVQLRQEPSELNKQVFSLLLLNRFVGENPFESSGPGFSAGSIARQSVSQLLTEQLNQLAGGLIGGVDINMGIISSDDYTTGTLQRRTDLNVGLSKRLLNDRLTVNIGSNFELDGAQQTSQGSSNIAGDVSVNYRLSKDGRYMLRFYRINEFQGVVDGYIIETGLGFSINVDYDRFSEVLRGKKAKVEGIDDKQKPLE